MSDVMQIIPGHPKLVDDSLDNKSKMIESIKDGNPYRYLCFENIPVIISSKWIITLKYHRSPIHNIYNIKFVIYKKEKKLIEFFKIEKNVIYYGKIIERMQFHLYKDIFIYTCPRDDRTNNIYKVNLDNKDEYLLLMSHNKLGFYKNIMSNGEYIYKLYPIKVIKCIQPLRIYHKIFIDDTYCIIIHINSRNFVCAYNFKTEELRTYNLSNKTPTHIFYFKRLYIYYSDEVYIYNFYTDRGYIKENNNNLCNNNFQNTPLCLDIYEFQVYDFIKDEFFNKIKIPKNSTFISLLPYGKIVFKLKNGKYCVYDFYPIYLVYWNKMIIDISEISPREKHKLDINDIQVGPGSANYRNALAKPNWRDTKPREFRE